MKKIIFICFALLLFVSAVSYSQEQISSKDAKDYIGKTVQVKGVVSGVFTSQKGNTFINFDEKSPNQTFTAAIFSDSNVDYSKIIEGCILTVYGEVKEYKGKPEIVIATSDQIISIEQK
ncbi:MAG: OB-fold nucleic acid binding domain-containing protein [Bacteroidetes bacterium]|nr:OB-fold nucleic acid binding domain-containing protein [Bacteroidota bacterium]